jgi:signal transduction histidine kinase
LRNPLGAIVNMTAALQAMPQPEHVGSGLALIDRAAGRMTRMIRDLLDLANIDAGHFSIERSPHDLARLIAQALDELAPVAAQKRISVQSQLAADLPPVACDGHRIVQVLSNLVGNALKFTAAAGAVKVVAERRAGDVLVAVHDTGPGIAAADLPHLFERFYRAKDARERGTGLGLAIAKAIIDRHDGTLGVRSEVGAGSAFFFTLPTAA